MEEQYTEVKINKNKTDFYNENQRIKSVYKNGNIEVVIFYTGKGSREKIKEVVTKINKPDGLVEKTTQYTLGKKYFCKIESKDERIIYLFDKNNPKRITKYLRELFDGNEVKSKEDVYYEYSENTIKKIAFYHGKFLKNGVGQRITVCDYNGNILSEQTNIERFDSLLSNDINYKPIKIFDESINKRFPNLPESDSCFSLEDVKAMLDKSITLDSGSLLKDFYVYNDVYDLPFKFATAVYNTYFQKGNANIICKIPPIFEGLSVDDIFEVLNKFSIYSRNHSNSLPVNSLINLKIGTKSFNCISLKTGFEGCVFRINSYNAPSVILKVYHAESFYNSVSAVSFAPFGLYGALSIFREANIAKVSDIPVLYLANPLYVPIERLQYGINYMGAWQLVEDANLQKSEKTGLRFKDFLIQHGLIWKDDRPRNIVNNVYVDFGSITTQGEKSALNGSIGVNDINLIYSRYINGETTQQILDFLNKKK